MTNAAAKEKDKNPAPTDPKKCGIVMPISACDGCSEAHWGEVKIILFDAIEAAGFTPSLVSDADDVGIIQKRIIQNLYENPVVVCDASGKNPNVMFELGIRLAFDKPTIIIKDDKTSYSFDTAAIEHLEYPRDLRFGKIVEFKKALADKVRGTHKRATDDPNYTTFLKHFGKFTVAKLETSEVSKDTYIIEELKEIRATLAKRDFVDRDLWMHRGERLRHRRINPIFLENLKKIVAHACAETPNGKDIDKLMEDPRVLSAAVDALTSGQPELGVHSDQVRRAIELALKTDQW